MTGFISQQKYRISSVVDIGDRYSGYRLGATVVNRYLSRIPDYRTLQ